MEAIAVKSMPKIRGTVLSFEGYINWVRELVSLGMTSGPKQTEELAAYTLLNLKRMERIYKTVSFNEGTFPVDIKNIKKQSWYVITEAWCGDSAQAIPVIAKIAEGMKGLINLKIIFRDENLEWIEKYKTNGSHSIPKLISFNEEGSELYTWGPRPLEAQKLLLNWKLNPSGKTWDDFEKELHTWYARDKACSIQNELHKLITL